VLFCFVSSKVPAHHDDINAVAFADESPHIIFSGSDDMLCKVWDRRALGDHRPVGVMAGHLGGITNISSKANPSLSLGTKSEIAGLTQRALYCREMGGTSFPTAKIRPSSSGI